MLDDDKDVNNEEMQDVWTLPAVSKEEKIGQKITMTGADSYF